MQPGHRVGRRSVSIMDKVTWSGGPQHASRMGPLVWPICAGNVEKAPPFRKAWGLSKSVRNQFCRLVAPNSLCWSLIRKDFPIETIWYLFRNISSRKELAPKVSPTARDEIRNDEENINSSNSIEKFVDGSSYHTYGWWSYTLLRLYLATM
jgi:hypothetical protein